MTLHHLPAWRAALVAALVALIAAVALATVSAAPADAAKAKGQARAERAVKRAVVHRYGVGTRVNVRCAATGRRRFGCGFAARRRSDKKSALVGQARVNRRLRVSLGRVAKIGG